MKFTAPDYESLKLSILSYFKRLGKLPAALRRESKSETAFLYTILDGCLWGLTNRDDMDQYKDTHVETAIKAIVKELDAAPAFLTTPLPLTEAVVRQNLRRYTKAVLPLTLTLTKPGGFVYEIEETFHNNAPTPGQLQEVATLLVPLFDCQIATTGGYQITFLAHGVKPFDDWTVLEKPAEKTY